MKNKLTLILIAFGLFQVVRLSIDIYSYNTRPVITVPRGTSCEDILMLQSMDVKVVVENK
jgi:hypothetical protein